MVEKLYIKSFVCQPYLSNSYVVTYGSRKNSVVVDPGEINDQLVYKHLFENQLKVEYILLTHEHFDHVAGLNYLRQCFDCQLIASAECSEAITDPKKNMSRYYNMPFSCSPADILVEDKDFHLIWNGTAIRFIKTQGHSRGSICFSFDDILFTGDTIIKDVKTPTNLPGSDKEKLAGSFDRIMDIFKEETIVYPGHGAMFRLKEVSRKMILG